MALRGDTIRTNDTLSYRIHDTMGPFSPSSYLFFTQQYMGTRSALVTR